MDLKKPGNITGVDFKYSTKKSII